MIISKDKKFVFIHNPKAAGTSVRNVLSQYDSFENFFWHRGYIDGIDHAVDKPHIALNDLSKTEYYKYLISSDYFVFGFVRNPYDRVYSAYQEKCRQWKDTTLDFNDFILTIDEVKIRYDYEFVHFCPQHYFFYNGKKRVVDYIGKLEYIDVEFKVVSAFLSIGIQSLPLLNTTSETEGSYLKYYNEKSIEIINRLYEKDFILFGYDMVGEYTSKLLGLKFKGAFPQYSEKSSLTQLSNLVNSHKTHISELSMTNEHLESQLLKLKESHGDLCERYKMLEDKHLQLTDECNNTKKELKSVLASRSWKLTSILRKLNR
ncbi:sulfotransferase family 2 domain-containing protein [Vibrio algivorus]|uniref:Sulfotransferase family protein n=1 Tax=Vibrio algivorus TaxID=1667024 RepID=A0A557P5S3_9VIBR|nr:sulfotransferase family 2 domain-containing protein [Vibrio algivorus]TVO35969.1 sulfotransferase family protein [Vibrio algivorus]